MAHLQFTDARGVTWEVWEVEPSRAERRSGRDRRRAPRPEPDRRHAVEDTPRVRISTEFAQGWLCFLSDQEKRRLAPVPERWELLDDVGLEALMQQATPVGSPRRPIE